LVAPSASKKFRHKKAQKAHKGMFKAVKLAFDHPFSFMCFLCLFVAKFFLATTFPGPVY